MKVMMIVMAEQRVQLEHLYESIGRSFDRFTICRLDSAEQKELGACFRRINPLEYDRVVIFLRLKRLAPQYRLLRLLPNLVFLEHDACQNYMNGNQNFGAYTRFYRRIPRCRVIASGLQVSDWLRQDGIDASFVPKGFDDKLVENRHQERDIPVAFVGSLKHDAYRERCNMLAAIGRHSELLLARTESGNEYVTLLNRIKIFVNADSGMNEYMIKNFEAMAAGCILLTEDQGKRENEALGFRDMDNVLLYSTAQEALERIAMVERNPDLGQRIAQGGERLAWDRFGFSRIATQVAEAVSFPTSEKPEITVFDHAYAKLFCPWFKQ